MPTIRIAFFLTALLLAGNAQAATKKHAALPPLHCPLPGDPDGMAKRLGPQGQMYCAEIERRAIEIELEGFDTFQAIIAKAFEKGAYDEWTLAAEAALAEFVPAYAAPIRELPLIVSQSF